MANKELEHHYHRSKPRYTPDVCEEVRKLFGFDLYMIASQLGVARSTLYDWEKKHKEFAEVLELARDAAIVSEIANYNNNVITSCKVKFAEKAHLEHLRFKGHGRRLAALKNCENESEELKVVSDALANGEITAEYAEAVCKAIQAKIQAKLFIEQGADIKKILDMLKMEL